MLTDLMPTHGLGFQSSRDDLVVADTKPELMKKIGDFLDPANSSDALRAKFFPKHKAGKYEKGDTRQWTLDAARKALRNDPLWAEDIRMALYRPFDIRRILYRKDMIDWPRPEVLGHMLHKNLALIANRQTKEDVGVFVADVLTERKIAAVYDASTTFPLYRYADHNVGQVDAFAPQHRSLNFAPKLYAAICAAAGIDPADQAGPNDDFGASTGDRRPSEIKVFDYIYGVLHAPDYRKAYAEFLKIDFPRIPYPASPEVFRALSENGEQLRRLHLMQPAAIGDAPYPFEGEGDDVVAAGYPKFENSKVWINPDQYFGDVSAIAWGFPIGGYQPAQKWLKDRRGRVLTWDDIGHYQKILKILVETDRIMREIRIPLQADEQDGEDDA